MNVALLSGIQLNTNTLIFVVLNVILLIAILQDVVVLYITQLKNVNLLNAILLNDVACIYGLFQFCSKLSIV
jgi:hypothetical protein